MWDEPYLESCCRSALHRLWLVGAHGRPAGLKDGPCLQRLAGMRLAQQTQGRFVITEVGRARHGAEIMRRATGRDAPAAAPAAGAPAR